MDKIIFFFLSILTIEAAEQANDQCTGSACNECLEYGKKCDLCSYEKSALDCNRRGDLVCGICKCNNGYSGGTCQIYDIKKRSTDSCIQPNQTAVCSGRGQCIYGVCECNAIQANSAKKYSGRFCQCDDYSCMYFGGRLCGGPDRGICECGRCNCRLGYRGDDCGCNTSQETCTARNGLVCNGHGLCLCGKCQCDKSSGFRGPTCEDCPNCVEVCRILWPCVQCKIWKQGQYDYETCENKCDSSEQYFEPVDQLQGDLKKCKFKGDDDCVYTFGYFYNEMDQIIVQAQIVAECPSPGVVVGLNNANIITQCIRYNFFALILHLIYFIFTI